jgi:hypothetical protein
MTDIHIHMRREVWRVPSGSLFLCDACGEVRVGTVQDDSTIRWAVSRAAK